MTFLKYFLPAILLSPIFLKAQEYQIPSNDKTLSFRENRGQVLDQNRKRRNDVLFSGNANGMVFHILKEGISYQMYQRKETSDSEFLEKRRSDSTVVYRTDIRWINPNENIEVISGQRQAGTYRYYNVSEELGKSGLSSYSDVKLKNVYPNIDLKFYGIEGNLEYDFILRPGSNANSIKWTITGADNIEVLNNQLVIRTPFGDIQEQQPVAFQDGEQIEVGWKVSGNIISFDLGDYDHKKELVIDPVVKYWGTYIGGSDYDFVSKIVVDDSNYVYVAGETESNSNIATSGAHQTTFGGWDDAYLARLNPDGTADWITYVGGSNYDYGESCVIDGGSNVYLVGSSSSDSNIATTSAFKSTRNGRDAFLIKFDKNGVRQWGTFFGGTGSDYAEDVMINSSGHILFSGWTQSSNNIATGGAYQTTLSGGRDGFVAAFSSTGNRIWATYFGGNSSDMILEMDQDNKGNLYFAGESSSTNLPGTGSTYSSSNSGGSDAFVTKFSSAMQLKWSTYYGSSENELANDVVVDKNYNVFICGTAQDSTTGWSTAKAHQMNVDGIRDAFIVKFDSTGNREWGTVYGGEGLEDGDALDTDSAGNVYLSGRTTSDNGIATNSGMQTTLSSSADNFIVQFNTYGTRQWGSYVGGYFGGEGFSKIFVKGQNIYCGGFTLSANGIATSGAHQTSFGGYTDGYVMKTSNCFIDSSSIVVTACDFYQTPAFNFITQSGTYFDTLVGANGCDSIIRIKATILSRLDSVHVAGYICDSGSTQIEAFHASGKIYWYDEATGGNLLDSGDVFQTPTVHRTDTFYIELHDSTCAYFLRDPVIVEVRHNPELVSTAGQFVCNGGTAQVEIESDPWYASKIWYADSTTSTYLNNGLYLFTDTIYNDTTFYVTIHMNNGCFSPRYPVHVETVVRPVIDSVVSATRCGNGTLNLSAYANKGDVLWYYWPTSTNPIDTGNMYTTFNLSLSRTFSVEAIDSNCRSNPRDTVWANVIAQPSITSKSSAWICDSGIVTLSATTNVGVLSWYDSLYGQIPLDTGTSYTFYTNTTKRVYIESVNSICSSVRDSLSAKIKNSTFSSQDLEGCDSIVSPSGKYTWFVSGSYMDTTLNSVSCNQIITVQAMITNIDSTVVSDGRNLTAQESGLTYQWYNCSLDTIVPGETNQSFTPTKNGIYAVILKDGDCVDTSECMIVSTVGLEVGNSLVDILIYPNPTDDYLFLQLPSELKDGKLELYNENAQLVLTRDIAEEKELKINLMPYAEGLYNLIIRNENDSRHWKILKR